MLRHVFVASVGVQSFWSKVVLRHSSRRHVAHARTGICMHGARRAQRTAHACADAVFVRECLWCPQDLSVCVLLCGGTVPDPFGGRAGPICVPDAATNSAFLAVLHALPPTKSGEFLSYVPELVPWRASFLQGFRAVFSSRLPTRLLWVCSKCTAEFRQIVRKTGGHCVGQHFTRPTQSGSVESMSGRTLKFRRVSCGAVPVRRETWTSDSAFRF